MENYDNNLDLACEKFRKILSKQLARVEDMKAQGDFTDYSALSTIRVRIVTRNANDRIDDAFWERRMR